MRRQSHARAAQILVFAELRWRSSLAAFRLWSLLRSGALCIQHRTKSIDPSADIGNGYPSKMPPKAFSQNHLVNVSGRLSKEEKRHLRALISGGNLIKTNFYNYSRVSRSLTHNQRAMRRLKYVLLIATIAWRAHGLYCAIYCSAQKCEPEERK